MFKLIASFFRWIFRKFFLLLGILAILLGGAWLHSEWRRLSEDQEAIRRDRESLIELKAEAKLSLADMQPQLAGWERWRKEQIVAAQGDLVKLDGEIQKKGREWSEKLSKFRTMEETVATARAAAQKAAERRDKLGAKVGWWQRKGYLLSDENKRRVNEYEAAKLEAAAKRRAYELAAKASAALGKAIENSPVKALKERRTEKEAALELAGERKHPDEKNWLLLESQRADRIEGLAEDIGRDEARVESDPRQRLQAAILEHLPTALWLLLAAILTPVAIKAFFYYVLAPLAGKLRPIRVLPGSGGSMPGSQSSAVSIPFVIGDGEEILVHPDYLQQSSQTGTKRTQWFPNRSLPFTSIASGMVFLTASGPRRAGRRRSRSPPKTTPSGRSG